MWTRLSNALSHKTIHDVLNHYWRAKRNHIRFVSRSANAVYRFIGADGDTYYARFSHEHIRPFLTTQGALHFQQYLLEAGLPVAQVIPTINGNTLLALNNGYYVNVVKQVKGMTINLATVDDAVMRHWGRLTGKLHRVAADYVPDDAQRYHDFREQWAKMAPVAARAETTIQENYQLLTTFWQQLPTLDSTWHITHGDYHEGNILQHGKALNIIDFDEPVFHWAIADVARVMLAFASRPIEQRRLFRDAFVTGYREEWQLDVSWLVHLVDFMHLRGMLMHLWTMDGDMDADSNGHDSPFQEARQWALRRYDF